MGSSGNIILRLENDFRKRFSFTDDSKRKLLMFLIMNLTSLTVVLIIGALSFLEGDTALALLDSSFSMILILLLIFIGKARNQERIIELTMILVLLFFGILFLTNRAGGHTFVWYYSFPVLSMFMMGEKKGFIYSTGLLLISVLPLLLPLDISFLPAYSHGFLIRFILSYLLVTFLIFLYERSREEIRRMLIKTMDELKEQAIRDGLTGLYNRRYLDEIWSFVIRDFHNSEKYVTFIMADLDYFKKYNDFYGHPQGDEVLREISRILKGCVRRKTDYVFRYGGEEFCFLLYSSDRKSSLALSDEIISSVRRAGMEHGKSPFGRITLSLGVVMSRLSREMTPSEIIQKADDALYQAKNEGRDRYIFVDE